jgi:AcrR family transcriptional regulator
MTEDTRPHHHGNLRAALISAGMDMLAEGKVLTLRQVAARAGVSHAAPAHHFDGLGALMTAIAARAFGEFAQAMTDARARAGNDPRARLSAVCAGYLDFAARRSGLFHLMFSDPAPDRANPDLARAAADAYGVLRDACQPFALYPAPDETLEAAVWALVHGYAMLTLGQCALPRPHHTPPPPFAEMLARLLPQAQPSDCCA